MFRLEVGLHDLMTQNARALCDKSGVDALSQKRSFIDVRSGSSSAFESVVEMSQLPEENRE